MSYHQTRLLLVNQIGGFNVDWQKVNLWPLVKRTLKHVQKKQPFKLLKDVKKEQIVLDCGSISFYLGRDNARLFVQYGFVLDVLPSLWHNDVPKVWKLVYDAWNQYHVYPGIYDRDQDLWLLTREAANEIVAFFHFKEEGLQLPEFQSSVKRLRLIPPKSD